MQAVSKKRLLIVQPVLTSYRVPVFRELAKKYDCLVVSSPAAPDQGYGGSDEDGFSQQLVENKSLFWGKVSCQVGVVSIVRAFRPDAIFINSCFHSVSFWLVVAFAKLKSIDVHVHTHGGYRWEMHPRLYQLAQIAAVYLSTTTICYSQFSMSSLTYLKPTLRKKLRVVQNTLVNEFPIAPSEKLDSGFSILFVGRLRNASNLDLLVSAVEKLERAIGSKTVLHVFGGGDEAVRLRNDYGDRAYIKWYGEVYDQEAIARVAKTCSLGCHPGDAGLSVVHYLSLSLPVVVHRNTRAHMGPEPSYIVDGVNGVLFDQGDVESLTLVLKKLLSDPDRLKTLSENAFDTYLSISKPTMAAAIEDILSSSLKR